MLARKCFIYKGFWAIAVYIFWLDNIFVWVYNGDSRIGELVRPTKSTPVQKLGGPS